MSTGLVKGQHMNATPEQWEIDLLDLDAYLQRIGSPARPPSRAALDELHEAHLRTFTFDNIDVLLEQHRGVHLQPVQEKFVERGRGGYCFEHVTLFAAALERLGYTVQRRLGRVGSQARTHAVVAVSVEGETLLADPGFTLSVLRPIPLRDRAHDAASGWAFRIRETRFGTAPGWELQRRRDGKWEPVHAHDELPVRPIDFIAGHHFTSTFPTTHFRTGLMVSKHTSGAHVTLTHETVTIRRPGQPTVRRSIDTEGLTWWLAELDVPLTKDEQLHLLQKVARLRGRQPATA